MRALFPEERAEILALHPDRTEEDLDAFEALLHETLTAVAADRPGATTAAVEEAEARLFPRFAEALELAAQRRDPEDLPVA